MLLDGVELTDVVPLGRVELSSLIACMRAGIDQKVSLNDKLVKKSLGLESYLRCRSGIHFGSLRS